MLLQIVYHRGLQDSGLEAALAMILGYHLED